MARRVSCCLSMILPAGVSAAGVSAVPVVSTDSTVSEADSELTLPRHEVPGADDQGDDGAGGADQYLGHLRGVGGGGVVVAVDRPALPERPRSVADERGVPGID